MEWFFEISNQFRDIPGSLELYFPGYVEKRFLLTALILQIMKTNQVWLSLSERCRGVERRATSAKKMVINFMHSANSWLQNMLLLNNISVLLLSQNHVSVHISSHIHLQCFEFTFLTMENFILIFSYMHILMLVEYCFNVL